MVRDIADDIPPAGLDALGSQIEETRRANERWLSGFLLVAAVVFTVSSLAQIATGSPDPSVYGVALVCVAYAVYYGFAWARAASAAPTEAEAGLRTFLEASVASLLTLLNAQVSADFAFERPSVVLYALATFITVLRLRPRLGLFAGFIGGMQWLTLWAWLAPHASSDLVHKYPAPNINRAALVMFCGVLAWRVGRSQRLLTRSVVATAMEHARVRRAFGSYVAEPVVQRILSGDLKIEPERRVVTVMFVDIRRFTSFSGRPPDEVLGVLNQALEAFSLEVRDEGGIVNKYLGDGLLALFGTPEEQPDHATRALRAAIAIARCARGLSDDGVYPGLQIGVGVHTGEVVVGDVGGGGKKEYTAIGDVVNVAARVEAMCKDLGESLLVTDAVVRAAEGSFPARELGPVALRGRRETVLLHALDVFRDAAVA